MSALLLRPVRTFVVLPALALALVASIALVAPGTAEAAPKRKAHRATSIALSQVGDPYRYGSAGPGSFDCSGLVKYSFNRAGIKLPRTSAAQAKRAKRIAKSKMRRGDLMFFHKGGRVYHVGIFVKRTKRGPVMVHAPSTGKRVSTTRPWTSSWFAGRI